MDSGTTYNLYGVWGTSSTNVFAVGDDGTILRYRGVGWFDMSVDTDFDAKAIWGSSETDVFAVGNKAGNVGNAKMYHFDNSTWQEVADHYFEYQQDGIWGTSSSFIISVGHGIGNGGSIYKYDGTRWSSVNYGSSSALLDVWGSSSADIFVVGNEGRVQYFDGSTWLALTSGTNKDLHSVWGSSNTNVFAVGDGGSILHYTEAETATTTTTIPDNETATTTIPDNGTTTIPEAQTTTTTVPDTPTTTTTSVQYGFCMAETIYGAGSAEAELLRHFRDTVLVGSPGGQGIIRLYNKWSPAIARAMESNEKVGLILKTVIDGMLPYVELMSEDGMM